MKRRVGEAIVMLLILGGLVMALRQDLMNLALNQGKTRLLAGDVTGAETAFRRAAALGGDAAPLVYNVGVGMYRKGEFQQAQRMFSVTLATAGAGLQAATLYNRGNCLFRQGEQLAVRDQEAARTKFQEAIADYGKALSLSPGAADIGGNLARARARLARLANGNARVPDTARTKHVKSPEGAASPDSNAGTGHSPAPAPNQQMADGSAAQGASGTESPTTAGKPRRELTWNEAERLLNEARGREKLAGPPHAGNPNEPLAKPDKDW